jgi:hypothetical protein
MRETVLQGLQRREAQELHAKLAEALHAAAGDDLQLQFRAAWHQSHTLEELKAAHLLARLGPRVLRSGVNPGTAVDAMERALEIYERHGASPTARLRMCSLLVMIGFSHDPKLAERYGEATVRELYRASGLHLVDRWSRRLGPRLAAICAIGWTSLARLLVPAARRPPSPQRALAYLGRSLSALMGTRTSLLDGPGTAALAPYAETLIRSGLPVAAQVAGACRASTLQPLGRESELRAEVEALLEQVEGMRDRIAAPFRDGWDELHLSLLFMKGVNSAFLPGRGALDIADQLEARGDHAAMVCAERLRMAYHAVRGQRHQTEGALRTLELHAIQGGSVWQTNAFWHPIEGLSGALYGDVVAARRALDQLQALVAELPSLTPMRDLVRVGYHYARGDHERAVEHGLPFVAAHPPRTVVGWAVGYALTAMALVELGRADEARDLARRGFEAIPQPDLDYFGLYMPLEGALALSEAFCGNDARGDEIFDRMEARVLADNEHGVAALLHQHRARLARLKGDATMLRRSLRVMSELAESSRDPVLTAHVDRITGLSMRLTRGSDPSGLIQEPGDAVAHAVEAHDATLVTRVLSRCDSEAERANSALLLLAQCAGALRAYLMVPGADRPELVAQLGEGDPPTELELQMGQLLERGRPGTRGRTRLRGDPATGVPPSTFVMVLLPTAEGERAGVAALEEPEDGLMQLRPALIEQVGRGLAPN